MPDTPSFVVNDRRKFTSEGELRHDAPAPPAADPEAKATAPDVATTADSTPGPQLVNEANASPASAQTLAELADLPETSAIGPLDPGQDEEADLGPAGATDELYPEGSLPPGPTEEQSAEAARAYEATAERLDTAMRAANPGGERMPPMSFERLVQSLYTQALLLLGGAAEPGETPRVDILGARQTIDMLVVVADKVKGNLSSDEDKLLESALFDLRMGFLEITQALARQAAQRQTGGVPGGGGFGPGPGGMPPAGGPRIVR